MEKEFENKSIEVFEKLLFSSECSRLYTFVKMYSSTYSDREVISSLITIIKEVIQRQEDPKGALEQTIAILRD